MVALISKELLSRAREQALMSFGTLDVMKMTPDGSFSTER
jgi:hypothetical protein